MRLPDPTDVIRIDRQEMPEEDDPDSGVFEWRYMKERYTLNAPLLIKEVETVLPNRGEVVLDRLLNFPRVFIVKSTGEVFTSVLSE